MTDDRDKQIERLQAEINAMRARCNGACRYWEARWRDEYAYCERLTEALKNAAESLDDLDPNTAKFCRAVLNFGK